MHKYQWSRRNDSKCICNTVGDFSHYLYGFQPSYGLQSHEDDQLANEVYESDDEEDIGREANEPMLFLQPSNSLLH